MPPSHHTRRGFRNNHPHENHGPAQFLKVLREFRRGPRDTPTPARAANDPAALRSNRSRSTLTWIGHSTFLVQVNGLNVLTDPHFTERASPVGWAGPRRHSAPGLALEDLPPVDVVVISHNHYDHLDEGSVRRLARRHPAALFAAPLGLRRWLARRGVARAIELDWWQAHAEGGWTMTAVPAQHFSGRTPTDRNRTLWCGWVLETGGRRLYFAGDTGYSPDFADIGARFAPIDLALIPIGAYDPRWFMRPVHVNPEEAVRIHRDVGARWSVGMHWGTFRLTTEPMDEPPLKLQEALRDADLPRGQFQVMALGETRDWP
jgi:N-acyl-phosphatidylethanolamine-hydrolysing phospholipase D